tara:strand:+ start:53 stop:673 length:621 start_codon:yes stop_codon:yes gene_type:complete
MFGSRRIITPHAGKTELAMNRVRQAAGILVRNGATSVNITKVGGGFTAGSLHLYTFYMSMEQGLQLSENLSSDPSWNALMAERELIPAGDINGPNVARLIAGEPKPDNKAFMVREYIMERSKWGEASKLVEEIQKMVSTHNVNVSMWVPILAEEMQRSMAVYSAPDLRTLGRGIDEVGMTEKFQKMLEKASELGTLDRAFGMQTVR